jgi:hypothetical protein
MIREKRRMVARQKWRWEKNKIETKIRNRQEVLKRDRVK